MLFALTFAETTAFIVYASILDYTEGKLKLHQEKTREIPMYYLDDYGVLVSVLIVQLMTELAPGKLRLRC